MLVRATVPVFVIDTRQTTVEPLGTAVAEAHSSLLSGEHCGAVVHTWTLMPMLAVAAEDTPTAGGQASRTNKGSRIPAVPDGRNCETIQRIIVLPLPHLT
jgi:hypothetical protein